MGLADNVLVLNEPKSFDDFSLNSFLIAVTWGGCETYAKLLVDKGCKGSGSIEGGPVRLVDEDQ